MSVTALLVLRIELCVIVKREIKLLHGEESDEEQWPMANANGHQTSLYCHDREAKQTKQALFRSIANR